MIEAYRIATGERIWGLRPARATLPSAVTSDGRYVVVPVLDNDAWTIDLVDLATGRRASSCPVEQPLTLRTPHPSDPDILLCASITAPS